MPLFAANLSLRLSEQTGWIQRLATRKPDGIA